MEENGVGMNVESISGLVEAALLRSAGELCEFVHAIRWTSSVIPAFAEHNAPLRTVLQAANGATGGSRKKRNIPSIPLERLGWTSDHFEAVNDLRIQLIRFTELAHDDLNQVLSNYTDVSERFWTAIETQCTTESLNLLWDEQQHEPLTFLSGE